MAWENLSEDIAEEFSDNRRLGWVTGFRIIQRSEAAELVRTQGLAQRRRGLRRRRRFLQLLDGSRPSRCARLRCTNLLPAGVRRGAPAKFCSRACALAEKAARLVVPRQLRKCTAPGCGAEFATHGRRTTCSNACRQRAWYYRKGGTTGAKDAGAGDSTQEKAV